MPDQNIMQMIDYIAHEVLMWIGFGTLVGLAAKALMPGRDPGGAIGTTLMGVVGSLIGCSMLLLIDTSFKITPISPLGFLAGTSGAFVLLFFFRLLSNSYIAEPVDGQINGRPGTAVTTYYRRRRRAA
ncbi:GlsB/YeaQ/YmgE family stress response membrane protein [Schlesneria paludicola]|uniref:GlsB/YeaQ/YmgE family stress response membrane protein n=1 Tax=Schlesneria paludicola TaxID=360056 RepID=UPI00029AC547|nr:transglycosylase [Schlesneria paludicola]